MPELSSKEEKYWRIGPFAAILGVWALLFKRNYNVPVHFV
jgi:hypothetical protein